MGPDAPKHVRNILIIVVLALAVWLLPDGAAGASTVGNLLSVIFLGALCFFGFRMYMEHRITLHDLDDRTRLLLYGSAALMVFALLATARMWDAGGLGALLWLALVGASVYGVYSVWRASREY